MDDLSRHPTGMLWSLRFRGGLGERIDEPGPDPTEAAEADWTWAHFPLADNRARLFLEGPARLPPGARELIDAREDRVQIHQENAWAYGVLPDLERDLEGVARDAGRLLFALDARRLVTCRFHALRVIDDVRREVELGQALESPPEALGRLVERYLEVLEARLEELGRWLDRVEDQVLDERSDIDSLKLGPLRREVSRHRRELSGLRSAVLRGAAQRDRRGGLLAEQLQALGPQIEDVDREAASLQERARLLHEEIDTLITSATNRSMRALTIISTLLIPPTLITGAFGMNVGGVPFGGSHLGFALAVAVCLLVVVVAYTALRRLRVLP